MDVNWIVRKLDHAFEGLATAPSKCMTVLHSKTAFILDPIDGNRKGISIILDPEDYEIDKLFVIRNRNETEFVIWAFDGCMDFRRFEGALLEKACESVVFNERIIAWVELKMEATAFSIPSANSLVSRACKQLLASVERVLTAIDQNQIEMPWITYQAYIGTPTRFPRRQVSNSEYALRLLELGVELQQLNVLQLQ